MRNGPRIVRTGLFVAGALPFVAWSLFATNANNAVTQLLRRWFRFQCHGRADRSLVFFGEMCPVCSRCLGIYSGLMLAALIARPRLSPRARRVWIVVAAGLMILEVFVQEMTGHPPIHALRLLTGVLLSYPVALTLIDAASGEQR